MNSSVGNILRQAREKQGRAIAEVAEELCLTQRYLQAIEADDLAGLPGIFFYKSFARQYAHALDVDPAVLEPAMQAMAGTMEPVPLPEILQVDPAVESTNKRYFSDHAIGWPVAALVLVVLGCTGFYAWWNRAPQPAGRAVASEPAGSMSPSHPAVLTDRAAPVSATFTSSGEPDTVVLNLAATDETWLSITSGGKEIFSGVLQASESKTVAGVNIATMRIGNAGGVEVRLNGKPIGPLGIKGEVLTVRFTPQDFQILRAEKL
jgi:cytoskeleton protein RodZ